MNVRSSKSQPTETPQAEAITVAWLVSVMMVTLLDVAAAGSYVYIAIAGAEAQRNLIASYALYAAAATGAISLVFAATAFKTREEKPPPKVTRISVFLAAAPIVAIVVAAIIR